VAIWRAHRLGGWCEDGDATVGQCTPSLNHSCTLADADIKQIIKTSQTNGTLPGYGPEPSLWCLSLKDST